MTTLNNNVFVCFTDMTESRTLDAMRRAVNDAINDSVNYIAKPVKNADGMIAYYPNNSETLDRIVVWKATEATTSVTFVYKNGLEVHGKLTHLSRTDKNRYDSIELTAIDLPRF